MDNVMEEYVWPLVGLLVAVAIGGYLAWIYVIVPYWPYCIIGLVLVAFSYAWCSSWCARRRQQEEEAARRARVQITNEILEYFRQTILVPGLVIDSNIWMNEEYDSFFTAIEYALESNQHELVLYGPQFDEICNLKKRKRPNGGKLSSREMKERAKKRQRARMAINRIERLQTMRLLRIAPVTLNGDRRAYADPLILKLLTTMAKNNQRSCFITDDKELRIRARALLQGYLEDQVVILGGNDLRARCQHLSWALNNGELWPGFSASCQ